MLMKERLLTTPWEQGCCGKRASAPLRRLSQVLFLPAAPHFSHLPYLNPALRLLGYGCSLKCLAGFKSCWASSISLSNVLSLICLSLCSSFRWAGQSSRVCGEQRERAGSSLFLLCGRRVLCLPGVISWLLLCLTPRSEPCSQLVVWASPSAVPLVISELCSNQGNRSVLPGTLCSGELWHCSLPLPTACLADILHPGAF